MNHSQKSCVLGEKEVGRGGASGREGEGKIKATQTQQIVIAGPFSEGFQFLSKLLDFDEANPLSTH